jgi:hypothetical protein
MGGDVVKIFLVMGSTMALSIIFLSSYQKFPVKYTKLIFFSLSFQDGGEGLLIEACKGYVNEDKLQMDFIF